MTTIAVVLGGMSAEAEISRRSGTLVAAALTRLGYRTELVEGDFGLAHRLRELRPDAVFNALHGTWGEDGRAQALFEWLELPYTGSGVTGCAISFDKHLTKNVLLACGLPTAPWIHVEVDGADLDAVIETIGLPLVIKPPCEGSSNGVVIVTGRAELAEAWAQAARSGIRTLVAEQYLRGRELTVAVVEGRALPVIEILTAPGHAFYSYDAKYTQGGSRHVVPAEIGPELELALQQLAVRAHEAVGLRDYSRTDFLLDDAGAPMILEINALPGLTEQSLLPDAAAAAGIEYDQLIEALVRFALARGRARESV